jgi:TetR/AcrR family fatty acid metabolism transcriptional regulator
MQRVSPARRRDLDSTGAGVEATREELLEAGARMFAERGYHHTTVEDVVAAAGVAKGTVYWYYRSKKALFLGVLERAATVYREELIETAGPARSPVARLERALEGTLRFARRRPDLCRLYFQQVHLDDPDFLRRRSPGRTSISPRA